MPKAAIFNMAGQQVGEYELSESVFGVEPITPRRFGGAFPFPTAL